MSEERFGSATDSDNATIRDNVHPRVIEDDVVSTDYEVLDELTELEEGEEEEELIYSADMRVRSAPGDASGFRPGGSRKVIRAKNATVDEKVNSIASAMTATQLELMREKYNIGLEVVLRVPEANEVACSEVTPEVCLNETFLHWGLELSGGPIPRGVQFLATIFGQYKISPGRKTIPKYASARVNNK